MSRSTAGNLFLDVLFLRQANKFVNPFSSRYVDYAMHRVRLLRHFGIKPYIVFDGGLLPAKKGTEHERKRKREENLARGNTLTAQGRHTQAREFYLKCIDVTPQMAFQFIKVTSLSLCVAVIHDFYRLYVQNRWIT